MKTPYKISAIEWDVDTEEEAKDLPSVVWTEVDATLDEMIDGMAAEFLSSRYGFCVKSCAVFEEKRHDPRKMFTVNVERTEKYVLPVNVLADSKEEAEAKVEKLDWENEYCDYWNELDPETDATYAARESDCPDRGEGPLK